MPPDVESPQPEPGNRIRRALRWLVPSVGLALIPKCPLCLAGYIALATGVGVSLPVAQVLRLGLLVVCVAALAWLAFGAVRRLVRRR
ncbi:MAG: hypothetical protein HYV95_00905 [Opitutae bacterium]|nr:hypothetical protein [Opitutae bacterium]